MSIIDYSNFKPELGQPQPMARPSRIKHGFKRVFDVMLVLLSLPFVPIIFLPIILAIKLESQGPVFFRQDRYGLNGKIIKVHKFRTMKQEAACADGAQQAKRGDDRVTRVGRFLRRTCLDELPQVFDVLAGRMSVVGPRPHPIGMRIEGHLAEEIIPGYMQRLRVLPGITGLAQVSGNRGPVDSVEMGMERIAFDNDYIERWTLWMDIRIILRTAKILSDNGSY